MHWLTCQTGSQFSREDTEQVYKKSTGSRNDTDTCESRLFV